MTTVTGQGRVLVATIPNEQVDHLNGSSIFTSFWTSTFGKTDYPELLPVRGAREHVALFLGVSRI
jgi:hypothetical protein